jgi:hypothetical protein
MSQSDIKGTREYQQGITSIVASLEVFAFNDATGTP